MPLMQQFMYNTPDLIPFNSIGNVVLNVGLHSISSPVDCWTMKAEIVKRKTLSFQVEIGDELSCGRGFRELATPYLQARFGVKSHL